MILDELLDLAALALPYFADHDRETCEMVLAVGAHARARRAVPGVRTLDEAPPVLVDGRVIVHPAMHELFAQLVELGFVAAPRPHEVGGAQLPLTVFSLATAYLMAANLSVYGYVGLTQGAAHLLEAFGGDELRATYMAPLYRGEWTGTMALTEPHAGSSLADITTTATPDGDHYQLRGAKIFISGGDHDLTDNIVHMTLARIAGRTGGHEGRVAVLRAEAARRGRRARRQRRRVTGLIHKIGWRGLPSIVLAYGERGDCRGWLVGEPHQGIRYMFQMMNEARIMVGLNGVATASVAYHESARVRARRARRAGRSARRIRRRRRSRSPSTPTSAACCCARRRSSRAGSRCSRGSRTYSDLAQHGGDDASAQLLLDLLTPIAKSFPAERGFEANALALQIHGGYGYSSEYLPEAWLRDQKLNSIHEGTTGIQAADLLGPPRGREGRRGARRRSAREIAQALRARATPPASTRRGSPRSSARSASVGG